MLYNLIIFSFLHLWVFFYTLHVTSPSSWPHCSDTQIALGEAASSGSPSSPPDCFPPPAGRTPAPQTAWSQTLELQLSVHTQIRKCEITETEWLNDKAGNIQLFSYC